MVCDGTVGENEETCFSPEECLEVAERWGAIDFVKYVDTGFGANERFGQCSGYTFDPSTEQYKMIGTGECEDMTLNDIDDEGLDWEGISCRDPDNPEVGDATQCNTAISYLNDNNLIFPGGTWFESALNVSESPIQINKDEDDNSILSAYLKCSTNSNCPGPGNSRLSTLEVDMDANGDIQSYRNNDGNFAAKTTDPWRTPPGQDAPLEAYTSDNNNATTGCYVNLNSTSVITGETNRRTGNLWCNRGDTEDPEVAGAKVGFPKICYANAGGELIPEDNSYIYYL